MAWTMAFSTASARPRGPNAGLLTAVTFERISKTGKCLEKRNNERYIAPPIGKVLDRPSATATCALPKA